MDHAIRESFHGIRSEVRFPTEFPATLHWDEGRETVEIADISNSGIRLVGERLPERHTDVRICADGLDELGRVMWRTAHACGVMLTNRIDALAVVRANCFPIRPERAAGERPSSSPLIWRSDR